MTNVYLSASLQGALAGIIASTYSLGLIPVLFLLYLIVSLAFAKTEGTK